MKRLHAARGATFFLDESDEGGLLVQVLDEREPDPARLLELENELRVSRDLAIPGLRRAIRRTEIDGRPALVSTFFAGDTLEQSFVAARQPIERFLEIAVRIADVIGALHAARIVHGQLSPRAIRVDAAFRDIEVAELGLASRVEVEVAVDAAAFASDPRAQYASPEQTGRMNRPVDWRSDLFSLGAVLHAMLAGRPPFAATDRLELVHQLIAVEPPRVHELVPSVPEPISAIVAKLLAKNAEDRYQSADGLRADLARCLEALRRTGTIAPFALGADDTSTRLALPRRLYGRDAELAALLEAADRTSTGAIELVLVAGPAGVGKTALVHEVHRPLAARRGRFVEGKFDQYQQELPFSALRSAFEQWVDLVLSDSDDELARVRDRIREAVGDLGGLITGLVPDLELVIGAQARVPELGPTEALNRFQYVLRRFLVAIADERRPLVLFVDDLQWADPGSLQLLGTLMSTREATHLLIVGAYRDNEVQPGHPFQVALDAMVRSQAPLSSIRLGPLDAGAVEQLVADALGEDRARVRPLAELVARETGGNALYVRQLLRSMDDERVLRFHHAAGRWEWDLRALTERDERGGRDRDVLDLIVARAKKLPDPTREALVRGACLGNRFDARSLAAILDRPLGDVAAALGAAIREGLLVPTGAGHRYLEAGVAITESVEVAYVFPHDRIQQAVYSLVPERDRAALHLAIGRALRAAGARVFDVAHQLNRGRDAMTDAGERRRLAQLNLDAALAAKRAAAYAAALSHLTIGIELLGGSRAWADDHALALALHGEAAECAYLAAALDRMEHHTEEVIAHGRSILESIRVYHLRVDAWTSQNRLIDAMRIGREALAQLGVRFPADPKMHHILLGLARTKLLLARKDVPALARQKRMTDPHKLEAMLLLERMVPPAYMSGSPLFPLLVFAMVDLSVKYGNSPLSPFGYGSFAITLSGVLGDIRSGEVFGRTALDAMEQLGAETFKAKVYFVLYVFIEHWTKHLGSCEAPLLDAYHSGMKAGNLVGATWSAYYRLLWMYFRGRPLPELEREAATYSAIFDQLKQNAAHRRTDMLRQTMLNLMGRTRDPVAFGGEAYADAEVETLAAKGDDATSRFFWHYNKLVLSFVFGRAEDAVAHGDLAKKLLESVTGLPDLPFYVFWDALARVRASERAEGKRKKALLGEARAAAGKLAKWGSFGPMNYQHKHDLVAAEVARAGGDPGAARELYDRAIDGATRHGYAHEAALAQELAARFHLDAGRRDLGAWYLSRAHEGYLRWGALAKVESLESEHASILVPGASASGADATPGADAIDLASVVKATTAISGEIVLDRLAAKLLEILIENAGAERGALVLHEGAEARVIAHKASPKEPVRAGIDEPAESGTLAPAQVLAYAARTKRSVVVDDAIAEPRFSRDPYVVARRVRSILCAPVVHHGDLLATVYLENNLAPRAFTRERVALSSVLGGQIAISLENAKLYRNLTIALDKQKELTSAYSKFTPTAFLDHLGRDSILDVKLGDHRHGDMTVVFLDIRAYTTLSESMSESDNFAFINGFLSRMTPAIARHHGVVSEFMGDGIMSFFPRRPEDALDACIEMQRAVRAYNVERRAKGRRDIAVGMGVHTGPLMIGIIGDRDRMSTALVSDTVNTAARMEGLTKEFQVGILASERTVSRVEGSERYGFRHIGDVRVKGKSEVLRVYECTSGDPDETARGKKSTRAAFDRGLERWKRADFRGAADAFEIVLREHAGDGTARRYLERSTEYLTRGSPTDWSGVETIDRK